MTEYMFEHTHGIRPGSGSVEGAQRVIRQWGATRLGLLYAEIDASVRKRVEAAGGRWIEVSKPAGSV